MPLAGGRRGTLSPKAHEPTDLDRFVTVISAIEATGESQNLHREDRRMRQGAGSLAAGPTVETEGGALTKVLVADDDAVTLHLVSKTVKRFGYDVVTARDGLEAQRKFAEGRFPLVVTDWEMPGLDGVELCRQIRNAALPSYTYIVFLTSRQEKHDLIEALSAGADDFISKPFHPQELQVRLRAADRILSLESDLREVNRDLAVLNRRLVQTSRIDPLMEIGNRLDFEEKISEYHFRAVRRRETYGVVMCDVDHFKSFNDTFGHQYGDRVLQTVAMAIRSSLRSTDAAFRYGGEEILLFLGNQNLHGAVKGAERVRKCIEREEIATNSAGDVRHLTISCGVASYPLTLNSSLGWQGIVECADRALYEAKAAGRNCVVGACPDYAGILQFQLADKVLKLPQIKEVPQRVDLAAPRSEKHAKTDTPSCAWPPL